MFNALILGHGFHSFISTSTIQGCSEGGLSRTDCKVQQVSSHLLQFSNDHPKKPGKSHRFSPLRLLFWCSLLAGTRAQLNDPFPAQFELSSLNGANGFILNGKTEEDRSGFSVSSAGDINGDGLADLVIGAYQADPSGRSKAGKSYVVYGSRTTPSSGVLELSSLNGTNGFILNGDEGNDESGRSVSSAGDINGDGLADLVIGAARADSSGRRSAAGKSYVVYGSRTPPSGGVLELSSLNGINGFILNGEVSYDLSGYSVSSAGDINGDGLADLVIGAYDADPSGRSMAGKSYVVYGNRTTPSGGVLELSSLNGTNGYILNGEADRDESGRSVSSAGDINGDGLADLVIGASQAAPSGRTRAGKSYVVYGNRTPPSGGVLELASLNGINGFILYGEAIGDESGCSVSSAGDINGDGLEDLVIGAYLANPGFRTSAGKSYVLYGSRTPPIGGVLELASLNGTNGFILYGEAPGSNSGISVSSAGDINGDGLEDLVIGASHASLSSRLLAGKSYVVFGSRKPPSGGVLELSSLNGTNGFILYGEAGGDFSGRSVSSAGDINGDGLDDLVIGASQASPSGSRSSAGKSYVLFGRNLKSSQQPTSPVFEISSATLPTTATSNLPSIQSSAIIMTTSQLATIPSSPKTTTGFSIAQTTRDHEIVLSSSAYTPNSLRPIPASSSGVLRSTKSKIGIITQSSTVKPFTSQISTTPSVLPQSQNINSIPLIAGIAAVVAALACSLFGGVWFILKRRKQITNKEPGTSLVVQDENSSEHRYSILTTGRSEGDYKDWPKEPKPHTKDQYDQVDLDQLNRERDQHQKALAEKRHEGYDNIEHPSAEEKIKW